MNSRELDSSTVEICVDGSVYKIVMPNMASDYIQSRIAMDLEPYELEMLRDMKSRLSATDLVLDIGANIGNHAFYLAEVVGCNVVAFEPNESLVFAMRQSVQLNNHSNRVAIENCALGDERNVCEFEKLIPGNIGSQRLICGRGDMQVRTLDDFVFEKSVTMLKIDVEGMELSVLEGARKLIRDHAPFIYVEAQNLTDFERLLDFFSDFKYFYWTTFNATPTHLFIPRARLSMQDLDFSAEHLKWAKKSYDLLRTQTNYKKLGARLKKSEAECEKLRDYESQVTRLLSEIKSAEFVASEAKASLIEKNERFLALGNELRASKHRHEVLELERLDAVTKFEAISEELGVRQRQLAALRASLAEKEERFERVFAELDTVRKVYEQLEGRHEEALANTSAVAKTLASAQLEVADLESRLNDKNYSYDSVCSALADLQLKHETLNKNLADEKSARRISEAKRSGHYKKLQYYRVEQERIKSSKIYRAYELFQTSKSIKARILFLPRFFHLLLTKPPSRRASIDTQRQQGGRVNANDAIADSEQAQVSCSEVRFETITELRRQAGLSGWPALTAAKDSLPKVLAVTDEFTTGCFDADADLIQPRPDNWQALFDEHQPDLAFIESAWKGNYGSWQFRVANYKNKPGNEIEQLTDYCRYRSKPSVFWNKEDPVHHEKFMGTANCADYIFTTDANMISSYKEKTGNANVYALPFAAQPALHYPAGLAGRTSKACFAGTWYGNRHQARGNDMQWLLKAALPLGVDIFDRNFNTDNFNFPEEYHPYIKGGLPYEALCNEYRRYRLFLNVNSVTDSPTMFSRRVFELLACGTPIVSAYAQGIEDVFGSDVVWMVKDEGEAKEAIETLLNDDEEWRRRSQAGIRAVFAKHTYRHRFKEIYEICALPWSGSEDPSILLFATVANSQEMQRVVAFANRQTIESFELLLFAPPSVDSSQTTLRSGISWDRRDDSNDSEKIIEYCASANATLAGRIDASVEYDEHYLEDLVNASVYAPLASVWTKLVRIGSSASTLEAFLFASLMPIEKCGAMIASQYDDLICDGFIYHEQGGGVSLSAQSDQWIVGVDKPKDTNSNIIGSRVSRGVES